MTHFSARLLRPVLRPAGPADAARLLPLMAAFNAAEQISVDAEQLRPALARLLEDPSLGRVWWIVAAPNEDVLGYAVVTFGYDLEFAGRDAFLTEIYLVPAARGAGVGKRALAALELEARALDVRALHLMVRPENRAARALYAGAGYEAPPRLFLSKILSPEETLPPG